MRRETYPRVYSQNEIYDIGSEILLLTKNDHNSTQKTPKSIIPESKKVGHSPSSDSVKSRFKALFKKCPSWIRRCCFSWIFAPRERLNQGAYKKDYTSDPRNVTTLLCSIKASEILLLLGSKSRFHHKINLLWIWHIQKFEQVHPVLVPTLPAAETIN